MFNLVSIISPQSFSAGLYPASQVPSSTEVWDIFFLDAELRTPPCWTSWCWFSLQCFFNSLWVKTLPHLSVSILPLSLEPSLNLMRVHCVIIQVTEEDGGQYQTQPFFLLWEANQTLSHWSLSFEQGGPASFQPSWQPLLRPPDENAVGNNASSHIKHEKYGIYWSSLTYPATHFSQKAIRALNHHLHMLLDSMIFPEMGVTQSD